ncbi:hypothetical protein [Methanospirillum hungatei]|uniref:hypothetical protein n=1 Tax=Methanospirillum hungatei TaxID=2203 RepID=UPI0026F0B3A6|nr:hypothetical protein [Methanospirillum hungatei]MCA1916094.1 hypothetical protein [Methanospirillum hungatei]
MSRIAYWAIYCRFIPYFYRCITQTENLSDIRDLIPAGMEIDKEILYELFEPEPIPSEADARFLTILSDEGFEVQQGAVKKIRSH